MTPDISPVVRYSDARAGIDWLVRAFGFEVQQEVPGPDGTIAHAALRFGGGGIAAGSVSPRDERNPWTEVRQGLYVAMDDVDAHFERAKAAGARIAKEPETTNYGSRDYSAWDPAGYLWGFGTYRMGVEGGEPSVFPELHYSDVGAISWLGDAFGFQQTAQVTGPDGAIVHAEMRRASGTIMLGIGGNRASDSKQAVSVLVSDPDAHHARSTVTGGRVVMAPHTTAYGARAYWTRDPEGFLWGFSTYRPEGT